MKSIYKILIFTSVIIRNRKSELKLSCKDIIKKVLTNLKRYTFNFAVPMYHFLIRRTFLMQYCSTAYTSKVYLPLALIREAITDNWLDSLCYYVWLKEVHHKPVFYAYSLRKLSAGINCSPTTLKMHISVLIKHDLALIYAGNLILKSTASFHREETMLVPIGISENKAEQRNLLRFATIKRNLHTQYRKVQQKSNALYYHKEMPTDYLEAKSALKLLKAYPDHQLLENSLQNVLTLSNNKFGSLCNRSQSTGVKIQKALNKLGLIVSTARIKLINKQSQNRKEFFRLELNSSHFLSKKGQVFKRLTNCIEFPKVISSSAIIGQ